MVHVKPLQRAQGRPPSFPVRSGGAWGGGPSTGLFLLAGPVLLALSVLVPAAMALLIAHRNGLGH